MLTTRDYIDLVHGRFDETTPVQLQDAFDAFRASGTNHLAVFFHGGLVSRNVGKAEAELLIDGYRNVGAYPFFFIWNSDLLTALQGWLFPFAENPVVRRVVERHIEFFSRVLFDRLNLRDSRGNLLRAIGNLQRDELPPPLTTLAALGRVVDSIWARRPSDVTLPPLEVARRDIRAFEEDVAKDVAAFGSTLNDTTRFTAALGSDIAGRLWERLRSGHDHGLYTSMIEEVAIAIGLDKVFAGLWGAMKDDIDQAFQSNAAVYGGTAFLDGLRRVWDTGTRLTLIGHSAGTVYINHTLNAMMEQKLPAEIKADIVFIAAALAFDKFATTMDMKVFQHRVRNHRLFALTEESESGYWEVPGVYDKSLLYLLSALCESDPEEDKALVGMQRYWSGSRPYNTPDIQTVTAQIGPGARVWSPTDPKAPPGFRANAREHGGFAREPKTNESVQTFLG